MVNNTLESSPNPECTTVDGCVIGAVEHFLSTAGVLSNSYHYGKLFHSWYEKPMWA